MSDRESEVNPEYPEVESAVTGSFSSNGNDPGAYALASEIDGEERGDGGTFLTDLARAMQTTAAAEQARDADLTEQRRKAHLDAIRAREAIEAEDLREIAKDDVKGIDAWSDGEIKRIKLERERRIASRREQLQIRLEEHRAVVAREVDAVEGAIASYRTEIERFFFRLGSETDPVEIARQAGTRPAFPPLDQIGPDVAPVATAYPTYAETPQDTATFETPAQDDVPEGSATYDGGQDVIAADPEPVQAEAEPEPAIAEAEPAIAEAEPEPAIAKAEQEPVITGSELIGTETHGSDGTPLIGVMDPEASGQPTDVPWQSGESTQPTVDEQPVTEGSSADQAYVADTSSGDASDQGRDGGQEQHADEGSGEPVTVPAEATVVMPRSTGAGSWLRWPNGSSDRSDPGE